MSTENARDMLLKAELALADGNFMRARKISNRASILLDKTQGLHRDFIGVLKKMISKVKEMIPPWVRVMRIQRDIPIHQISAGITKSHIRELVKQNLKEHGKHCNCISDNC